MCLRERKPLPKAIQDAPSLLQGLELFYLAFMDLGTSRSIGFGEGPIPWTAIYMYCQAHEIEGEQQEDMFYHIQQMDSTYLEFKAKKAEQRSKEK